MAEEESIFDKVYKQASEMDDMYLLGCLLAAQQTFASVGIEGKEGFMSRNGLDTKAYNDNFFAANALLKVAEERADKKDIGIRKASPAKGFFQKGNYAEESMMERKLFGAFVAMNPPKNWMDKIAKMRQDPNQSGNFAQQLFSRIWEQLDKVRLRGSKGLRLARGDLSGLVVRQAEKYKASKGPEEKTAAEQKAVRDKIEEFDKAHGWSSEKFWQGMKRDQEKEALARKQEQARQKREKLEQEKVGDDGFAKDGGWNKAARKTRAAMDRGR
ncbi:hypothetical protein FACS1894186_7610 [Alphaproteobacteria bacterium]|nr:hypothetical protein FACS1894186_7610 [Alphaproteobacteria bacterium]